jgi:hypothetical protein
MASYCMPELSAWRKDALLKAGNKDDRIDARTLAELLRSNLLGSVYHGEHSIQPSTSGRAVVLPLAVISLAP